jgi:hypothetical protein
MPEFAVTIETVRVGLHTVTVQAADSAAARRLVEADCQAGTSHCPPEWCTDDVASTTVGVRQVPSNVPVMNLPERQIVISRGRVQQKSPALALMAVRGYLPTQYGKPVGAIFADTGFEPSASTTTWHG